MFRVAVANMDFTDGGDRALLRYLCDQSDLLLLVETKTHDIARLVPEGWGVLQHTGGVLADSTPADKARGGVTICFRYRTLSVSDFKLTYGSGPGVGVMRRFIGCALVTDRSNGRSAPVAVSHWPLKKTKVQGIHNRNVKKFLAQYPEILLAGDGNQHPAALTDYLDLEGWGREVMFFGWDGMNLSGFRRVDRAGSDHPILFANVEFKEHPMKYDYAKVLRDAGCKVVEIPGWQSRRRPGEFGPVGVLWHHTGGAGDGLDYAKWLFLEGRSDLPAPLCQLAVGRDGTWYVGAAGRANHAGKARSSGTVAAGDGNRLYIGVECMNTGSEGWSKAQYDAMVQGGAALGKMLGTSVQTQRAHRETSVTGKWDPGLLDMDRFRLDIDAAMRREVVVPVENGARGARIDEALTLLREAAAHAEGKGWKWRARTIRAAVAVLERLPAKAS